METAIVRATSSGFSVSGFASFSPESWLADSHSVVRGPSLPVASQRRTLDAGSRGPGHRLAMSVFDPLPRILQSKSPFTATELDFLEELFVPTTLRPGEFLQRAGEPVRHAAFVAKGCLRSYVTDANGEEVVLEFAPENWWIGIGRFSREERRANASSTRSGNPTSCCSTSLRTRGWLNTSPLLRQCSVWRFEYAAAEDRRIVNALSLSAEERYLDFLKTYPAIVLQVPQRMLASYSVCRQKRSAESASISRKSNWRRFARRLQVTRKGCVLGEEIRREGDSKH